MKTRRIFFALAATVGLLLLASPSMAAQGMLTALPVTVYPMSDGSFAVGFNVNAPVCSNIGPTRFFYVAPGQFAVNSDGAKNMLATVLMAYSLGKQLTLIYDDNTISCFVNRLFIAQ